MVKIRIVSTTDGRISSISASGHSGYAERGFDIVCSGISALLQTAVIGISRLAYSEKLLRRKDGFMSIQIPDALSYEDDLKVQFLIGTIVKALGELAAEYSKFVCIEYKRE